MAIFCYYGNIKHMFNPLTYKDLLETDLKKFSELNRKFLDQSYTLGIDNFKQRREFLKHLTLISLGVLAFVPLFLDKVKIIGYFNVGIVLEFFVIFLSLIRLREDLDEEIKDLSKEITSKTKSEEVVDLSIEFLAKEYTESNYKTWYEKRFSLFGKKTEPREKENLDYFFEVVLLLMATGIAFVLGSILLNQMVPLKLLLPGLIFIIILLVFMSTKFIMRPLNYIFNLFRSE